MPIAAERVNEVWDRHTVDYDTAVGKNTLTRHRDVDESPSVILRDRKARHKERTTYVRPLR